jgi:enoyl-CoA hydratase/carnithine racemase
MLYLGDALNAEEALRAGLIDKVYDSLYEDAQAAAEKMAAMPRHTLKAIKEAFQRHAEPDYSDWEHEQSITAWGQPERAAAMQKFVNR